MMFVAWKYRHGCAVATICPTDPGRAALYFHSSARAEEWLLSHGFTALPCGEWIK